jgi:hypothetical protein
MLLSSKSLRKAAKRDNIPFNLPAPVGGINAVSSIMVMPPTDAVVMENWLPYPDRIQMRPGATAHVTGSAATVEALYSYGALNGANTLYATTNSGVYDVTAAGALPAASIALTEGQTVGSILSTGAANYLTIVNGVDSAVQYNGAAWSSIAAFGAVNSNTFIYVETYRQRLFFIVENTLEMHYLAANAIAGAGTAYNTGSLFRRGGYLVALGTWTIDGGAGPDDHLVAVTNQGEVAVFVGSDPATWSLKGVYYIGRPLGKKPLYKYGGDLLFLCENGLFPLSKALLTASIDRTQSITRKITQIFSDAGQRYFSEQGWEMTSMPDLPLLIVNIPGTPIRYQYCMHLTTGSWSIFSGWTPYCFARNGASMYFGTATGVSVIGGSSDYGANITATALQAFSTMGMQRDKKIEEIRPIFEINGNFSYTMGIASDFKAIGDTNVVNSGLGGTAALWGSAVWGTSLWTASTSVERSWRSVPDYYSVWKAFYLQVISNTTTVEYLGCDLLAKAGGSF